MKQITTLTISVMALAVSLYAQDAQKQNTMKGWLCNSGCVTQNDGRAACNQSCADKSGEVVLVGDDGRVLKIVNQDKVKSYAGKKVKMKCRTAGPDDAMFVDNISLYGGGG